MTFFSLKYPHYGYIIYGVHLLLKKGKHVWKADYFASISNCSTDALRQRLVLLGSLVKYYAILKNGMKTILETAAFKKKYYTNKIRLIALKEFCIKVTN